MLFITIMPIIIIQKSRVIKLMCQNEEQAAAKNKIKLGTLEGLHRDIIKKLFQLSLRETAVKHWEIFIYKNPAKFCIQIFNFLCKSSFSQAWTQHSGKLRREDYKVKSHLGNKVT